MEEGVDYVTNKRTGEKWRVTTTPGKAWSVPKGEMTTEDGTRYRHGDPVSASSLGDEEHGHVEGCEAIPVFKDDETEPLLYLSACAEPCPHLEHMREQARQLAKERGWVSPSSSPGTEAST